MTLDNADRHLAEMEAADGLCELLAAYVRFLVAMWIYRRSTR